MPTWNDSYNFDIPKDNFRLITGRYVTSTQTASSNNNMLKDMQDTNCLWINDQVAKKLNITHNDTLVVSSSVSSIVIKAYLQIKYTHKLYGSHMDLV